MTYHNWHLAVLTLLLQFCNAQNPEWIAQMASKRQLAQLLTANVDVSQEAEILSHTSDILNGVNNLMTSKEESRFGYRILRGLGVSELCITDLFDIPDYNQGLMFIDTNAKIAPGFLTRLDLFWDGNYKGCRGIEVERPSRDPLRGKYCWVQRKLPGLVKLANPNYTMKETHLDDIGENTCGAVDYTDFSTLIFLKFAICLPEKCSNYDATVIVRIATALKYNNESAIKLELDLYNNSLICGVSCQENELHVGSDGWAIACLVVIALLAVMMLIGTLLDVCSYRPTYNKLNETETEQISEDGYFDHQHFMVKIFLAFSIRANGAKIFDLTKRKGQIDCLHGIRFFSLTWVIVGHTYGNLLSNPSSWRFLTEFLHDFFDQVILNATFSVDTFFLMSGLLVSFLFLKQMKKCEGKAMKSPFFWFQYYFHRYLRLTPLMALMMWISASLIVYMTNGPYWNQGGPDQNCGYSWWTNLLYVNNLVHTDRQCYGIVWYLACDMQFYAFAPLVLVPAFWYPFLSGAISFALVVCSMAANAYLVVVNHYPPSAINGVEPVAADYPRVMYDAPWIRWCPYVTGLMLGLIMHKTTKPPRIHWVVNLSIWLITCAVGFALVFGLYPYSMGYYFPVWERAFYSATCRFVWSLCVAWVIFACYYGYGGFINTFMSWSLWFPFSRLSYAAYLGHWVLLITYFGSMERSMQFDTHLQTIGNSVAITMITYVGSIALSLALELPIITLEKIIFHLRAPKEAVRANVIDTQTDRFVNGNAVVTETVSNETDANAEPVRVN